MLSEQAKAEIRALMARYPEPRSALGMALYVAQREAGWLPPEVHGRGGRAVRPRATEVRAFASFYDMLHDDASPGSTRSRSAPTCRACCAVRPGW